MGVVAFLKSKHESLNRLVPISPPVEAFFMGNVMKAIETVYKGYRFRSRLEARWAVFFNYIGVEWDYEPEGYVLDNGEWYLPDFLITSNGMSFWCEIKGKEFSEKEINKCRLLSKGSNISVFMLNGVPNRQYYQLCMGITIIKSPILIKVDHPWVINYNKYNKDRGFVTQLLLGRESRGLKIMQDFYFQQSGISSACEKARQARFEHGEAP